jgi:hypothetical protein
MLVPIHSAYFADVVVHADTLGLFTGEGEGDLKKIFDDLGAFRDDTRVLLYPGVTPNSFGYFVETNTDGRWESVRSGELVFHGARKHYGASDEHNDPGFGWSICPHS